MNAPSLAIARSSPARCATGFAGISDITAGNSENDSTSVSVSPAATSVPKVWNAGLSARLRQAKEITVVTVASTTGTALRRTGVHQRGVPLHALAQAVLPGQKDVHARRHRKPEQRGGNDACDAVQRRPGPAVAAHRRCGGHAEHAQQRHHRAERAQRNEQDDDDQPDLDRHIDAEIGADGVHRGRLLRRLARQQQFEPARRQGRVAQALDLLHPLIGAGPGLRDRDGEGRDRAGIGAIARVLENRRRACPCKHRAHRLRRPRHVLARAGSPRTMAITSRRAP